MNVNTPDWPALSDAIVSVSKVEPTASPTITPPSVSDAPTTWSVNVAQLLGRVAPFSVMTMLVAVRVTLLVPPQLDTFVYVMA